MRITKSKLVEIIKEEIQLSDAERKHLEDIFMKRPMAPAEKDKVRRAIQTGELPDPEEETVSDVPSPVSTDEEKLPSLEKIYLGLQGLYEKFKNSEEKTGEAFTVLRKQIVELQKYVTQQQTRKKV